MAASIAGLRRDYSSKELSEESVDADPIKQFAAWWEEAVAAEIVEPNAMTLATSSSDGFPSARIVLLKGFSDRGFTFFSNYQSFKGRQLKENPKACLVFLWKELERQVRITGNVIKLPEAESDEYFQSRPLSSQMGAIASPQSQVIESRKWLDDQFAVVKKNLENSLAKRPAHWGGYVVVPLAIEFWQGRTSRLHDRILYSSEGDAGWTKERLAP